MSCWADGPLLFLCAGLGKLTCLFAVLCVEINESLINLVRGGSSACGHGVLEDPDSSPTPTHKTRAAANGGSEGNLKAGEGLFAGPGVRHDLRRAERPSLQK